MLGQAQKGIAFPLDTILRIRPLLNSLSHVILSFVGSKSEGKFRDAEPAKISSYVAMNDWCKS